MTGSVVDALEQLGGWGDLVAGGVGLNECIGQSVKRDDCSYEQDNVERGCICICCYPGCRHPDAWHLSIKRP